MEGTKRCVTCHLERPLSQFNVRRSSPDGRQGRCRDCCRQWYLEHKAQHVANVRRRNDAVLALLRARLADHLRAHPCIDCGESDLRVLDLDHRDPATKVESVTVLLARCLSWPRVVAEIEKCDVRCANCHRKRTSDEGEHWRSALVRQAQAQAGERAAGRLASLGLRA